MAENISSRVAWRLRKAIKATTDSDAPQRGTARVMRRDSTGTVWLRFPGSSVDTPVTGAVVANVDAGDVITYAIQGGRVSIEGNASDPSVGERVVGTVRKVAARAASLASSAQAIAEATGQHFWHDDNGAHISTTDRDPAGARNAVWNSLGMLFRAGTTNLLAIVAGADSGMDVYDGQGNGDENIIASHRGSGSRIGRSSENHVLITPHNLRSYDEYGKEILRVGKNVEADGYNPSQDVFVVQSDGQRTFTIQVFLQNVGSVKGYKRNSTDVIDPLTITLNGTELAADDYTVSYVTSTSQDWAEITLDSSISTSVGDEVAIAYRENFVGMSMHFGPYSDADGNGGVALGYDAFALGTGCHATGVGTSATGSGTSASGGYYAQMGDVYIGIDGGKASGRGCQAGGIATIARGNGQAVFGRANVEDTTGKYGLIVGNGHIDTTEGVVDSRSNAFAVGWNGDLTYQGTLHGATWQTGTSGTTAGGTTTLPASGTYILVTGHNSTPALNGVWIVRTGGNTAFRLAGGGNVTVTVSGTTVSVTTTSGTVNVYYQLCG